MTEDAQLLPVEAIVEEVLGLHPSGWTLVQHATQTILRLAGLGRAILVGRGANIITARLPNVFHVVSENKRLNDENQHLKDQIAALFEATQPSDDLSSPSVRENFSVLTSRAGFMAKMPFSVSQEKSIRIADICCLIVAGEPGCCSMYAATVIGSISSRSRKPARGTNPGTDRWHDSKRSAYSCCGWER